MIQNNTKNMRVIMEHWIFDLDGTLVDSLSIHFQVMEQVFIKYNTPFGSQDHHDILKINARTLPDYFELRFGKQNVPEALTFFNQLSDEAVESVQPFNGIENVLKTLKDKGSHLAVWTARDLNSTTRILNATGLSTYFSITVTGNCTSQGKPHPEGLEKIASHFRSDHSTMIMIGDFDSDMIGAQTFGIKSVRVLWHPSTEKERCKMATWQFHDIEDFHDWIKASPNTSLLK